MPLCIGVDCDEVLSETIDELLKRSPLREKRIQKSDISSYEIYEVEKV
jgi:5'(3')-deoxyribonucleotidase